jgi:hypothetical protein
MSVPCDAEQPISAFDPELDGADLGAPLVTASEREPRQIAVMWGRAVVGRDPDPAMLSEAVVEPLAGRLLSAMLNRRSLAVTRSLLGCDVRGGTYGGSDEAAQFAGSASACRAASL